MKASDFIIQIRSDLQEKSQQWKNEELFIKLQSSYITLQADLPFFITKESIDIQKDKLEYYLLFTPLKEVDFKIADRRLIYSNIENFYIREELGRYSFIDNMLLIKEAPQVATTGSIVYRYEKVLKNSNCEIELPLRYFKALRLLFKADIYEKPTRNTKERNLNLHYLKLYNIALQELKADDIKIAKGVTSKYQKI